MPWEYDFRSWKFTLCSSQWSIMFIQPNKFLITKIFSIPHSKRKLFVILLSLATVTAETTTVTDSTTSSTTLSESTTTAVTDSTSTSTEPTTSTSTTSTTARTTSGTCPDPNNVCKTPDEFVAIPGYCGPDYYICVSCSPYVNVRSRMIYP